MAEQTDKSRTLDIATLTPLVRAALGRGSLEVTGWHSTPLGVATSQIIGTSFGVFRITGQAVEQGKSLPWSLILKIIGTTAGSEADDPATFYYWKPEVLVYQSRILEYLPLGLKAPRCFAVVEKSLHEYWVWLEDVQEAVGRQWPLERYRLAALHLGQFNGAYLAGEPIPKQPWMAPPRTPSYVTIAQKMIDALPQLASKAVTKQWFTEKNVERILRLWALRDQLLDALTRLPHCFCHHDAYRRNLIARTTPDGMQETVAVDWSYANAGVVGVEIAFTTASSLRWMEVDASQARALDQAVFEGYLEGLRLAGWQGDQRLARFGYTANAALFAGLGHLGLFLPALHDESTWPEWEQLIGHPMDRVLAQAAELQPFLLDLGDEAVALMEALR